MGVVHMIMTSAKKLSFFCAFSLFLYLPCLGKMVSSGKLEVEVEFKSPSVKVWGAIRDSPDLFPKILPDQYKSIQILEGDGKSAGSILDLKYAKGISIATCAKEKIEIVEDENMKVSYRVIDGDILGIYKTFMATLQIIPNGQGCVAKCSVEYEKVNEEVAELNLIHEFAVKTFKGLDAYLLGT